MAAGASESLLPVIVARKRFENEALIAVECFSLSSPLRREKESHRGNPWGTSVCNRRSALFYTTKAMLELSNTDYAVSNCSMETYSFGFDPLCIRDAR